MKLVLISLIVLLIGTETPQTESFKPILVLELFTSQGCSINLDWATEKELLKFQNS